MRRVPVWMLIIIIVAMLPVATFPIMLSMADSGDESHHVYLWLYPAYVLATGYLAWQSYGRRTEMTWILIVLMLLSHAAMWILTTGSY